VAGEFHAVLHHRKNAGGGRRIPDSENVRRKKNQERDSLKESPS